MKDALAKVQSVTGVEMIFKVEISGNQVTDKWVEIYERLGDKTLKRFNYGTDALTVVRETSHHFQDLFYGFNWSWERRRSIKRRR